MCPFGPFINDDRLVSQYILATYIEYIYIIGVDYYASMIDQFTQKTTRMRERRIQAKYGGRVVR